MIIVSVMLTFNFYIESPDNSSTTLLSTSSSCGSRQLQSQESSSILEILKLYSLPMQSKEPLRIFEIYDTQTRQLIISCPSCIYTIIIDDETKLLVKSATELAHKLTLREMDKQQQQIPLKEGTTCTHHSHSTSTAMLEPHGLCRIEKIIITYGNLTFSTYQITPMMIETTLNHQHPSSYHHYMHCAPVIDSDNHNRS